MASIYINNTEKRQTEGTTLLNLQSSFPNCWLTQCEDGVEIRVPAYVLESGKKYIFNTTSQPAPRAPVTFESLLVASGYKQSDLDAKVVQRTKSRYTNKVLLALYLNDSQLAREAYERAQGIPQTNTCRLLADSSIEVDRTLIGFNEHLVICFVNFKPSVIKAITRSEYNRAEALVHASVAHDHIVPIRLENVCGKYFVIMPLLPITVEHLCGITESRAIVLWDQIGSALEHLHGKGFVHKDVKSANICLGPNGDFILIDLGDTVQVGFKSASTAEFVPADIDATEGATFAIDWWMLAMTVYDRMQPTGKGLRTHAGGQQLTTTSLLSWFHEGCFDSILRKIRSKMDSLAV